MFENFRNKCIEIYEIDPACFLSAPGLAWKACLKKTGIRLELLTNIDMLFIVAKEIRVRICRAIHRYAKANNRYMKNYGKNTQSYLMCLDANNLYGWAMSQRLPNNLCGWVMSQRLPVNGFEWMGQLSEFDERFIKIMMEIMINIFLK